MIRKPPHLNFSLVSIIIILAIAFQVANFLIIPQSVGFDSSWQFQAAQRLIDGQGLTASMDDLSILKIKDGEYNLSNNLYNYLTNWPPLYSLIISLFLLIFSPPIALGIVKLLFWLVGLLGWYKFIKKQNTTDFLAFFFLIFVILTSLNSSGTSVYVWSLFPFIVMALTALIKKQNIVKNLVIISSLTAFSVALRYQMLLFIPSLGLLYLIATKKIILTIKYTLITTTPALLVYLVILYFNRLYGVDLFISSDSFFNFDSLLSLPKSLFYLPSHILLNKSIAYKTGFMKIIVSVIINLLVVLFLISYKKEGGKNIIKYIIISFGIITFLQLVSMGGTRYGFNKVLISRYWFFLNPLIGYLIIKTLWNGFNIERIYARLPILFFVLLLSSFVGYFSYKTIVEHRSSEEFYNNYSKYTTYIDNVIKDNKLSEDEVIIFTGMYDPNALYRIFNQDNKYPNFRRLDILNNDKVFLSNNEKLILMVHETVDWQDKISSQWKPKLLDKNYGYSVYVLN